MPEMIVLTVALAVLVGLFLGLLGGGGSILTVPLLAYVAGMDAKQAIATSLLVVGVTSAVGVVSHARAGHVRWRTGLIFGGTAMVGAYAGGLAARFVPGAVLLVGFAVMMIATAVAMLRGRRPSARGSSHRLPMPKIVIEGLVIGLVTGMVGAGGGFLVVPALVLLGGLPMPAAVGTSLLVIAMKSFAGLGGYLASVDIDWMVGALVSLAAVVGALVGARLTRILDPDALRTGFGWFVLLMSAPILAQEIHPLVGVATAAITLVAAATYYLRRGGPGTRTRGDTAPASGQAVPDTPRGKVSVRARQRREHHDGR